MRPLHICYVEKGYPHPHGGGGAGTYIRLVGRELAARGHRVSVVTGWCSQCPPRMSDSGVNVYRVQAEGPVHWYAARTPGLRGTALALRYLEEGRKLYRFIEALRREHPISILEFSEGGDFWHGLGRRVPYVAHLHGSRYTFLRQCGSQVGPADWRHRRLELAFIRRSRRVVSPSRAMAAMVERELGAELPRKTVVPLPVDPALLNVGSAASGGGAGGKVVLLAARNDPAKGADVLSRAIPLVRRSVGDAEFRFIGCRPTTGGPPPPGVRLLPFMGRDELSAHYAAADLCVVPSLWDNSPNTVYEAMAAGRAVVASSVGGIPELVANGQTGLLVPPGDPPRLAEAIVRLLRGDAERTGMGARGRRRIGEIADLGENVTRRLELYEAAAAGH